MIERYGVSKTGKFIEFPNKGKPYWKLLALRSFAMIIDYMLMFLPQILIKMFTNFDIWALSIASFIWSWSYFSLMFIAFKKTVGMALTKLSLVHSSGFILKYYHLGLRSCISAMYVVPIFGWALILCNIISTPFARFTLVDYLSATQIVTTRAKLHLEKLENDRYI